MLKLELQDNAGVLDKADRTHRERTGGCIVEGCTEPIRARRMCATHYQKWKVHGDPRLGKTRGKAGLGHIDGNGYHKRSINAKPTPVHREIAEKLTGIHLPNGSIVHHLDENKLNNEPSNLVICQDIAYHCLLHARMRAFKATGDPSARPCCRCGRYDSIENLNTSGTQHYHASCNAEHVRKIKERKNAELTR